MQCNCWILCKQISFKGGWQCDQMVRLFSIFGHLQQWKLAQYCHKFAKVGSLFCQIRNKPSKIGQQLVNFCQSGEILPNLVTLVVGKVHRPIEVFCPDWQITFWNLMRPILVLYVYWWPVNSTFILFTFSRVSVQQIKIRFRFVQTIFDTSIIAGGSR